jgi:hypothetical protein
MDATVGTGCGTVSLAVEQEAIIKLPIANIDVLMDIGGKMSLKLLYLSVA